MTHELRPYEADWLARIRAEKSSRVLIVGPTGSGKTVVAATMMRDAVADGKTCLFVAHRIELVRQTVERLKEHGVPGERINVIAPGYKLDMLRPIHVASIQTLTRRGIGVAPDVVFVDEAHHAAAKTWSEAIGGWVSAGARVYGLTATPCRLDGKPLGDLFDAMVESEPVESLVAAKWLAHPRLFSVAPEDRPLLSGVKVTAGDYNAKALAESCNNRRLVGKIVDEYKRLGGDMPAVCYAVDVKHADTIVQQFTDAGIAAAALTGNADAEARKAMVLDLKRGRLKVLVNCMVLTEGWDCPPARVAIMARPTMSEALYLQMCGRVMRPGKTPLILDHAGNSLAFGHPAYNRAWSLTDDRKKVNRKTAKAEKLCPECGSSMHLGCRTCENCGHQFWSGEMPEEVAGQLREVNVTGSRSTVCVDCGVRLSKGSSWAGCKRCIRCSVKARAAARVATCVDCGVTLNKNAHLNGTKRCRKCSDNYRASHKKTPKCPVCGEVFSGSGNMCAACAGVAPKPLPSCVSCGATLSAHARGKPNPMCRKCHYDSKRVQRILCIECGKVLHRRAAYMGHSRCRACSIAHKIANAKPLPKCNKCGAQLSKGARNLGTGLCQKCLGIARRIETTRCVDCHIELSASSRRQGIVRCRSCALKQAWTKRRALSEPVAAE